MAVKVPNGGEIILLSLITQGFSTETATLRLFKNDLTPGNTSVSGDFTEANFDGYGSLNIVTWNTPTTNGSGEAEVTEQNRQFACNGSGNTPQTIYGYYVTGTSGLIYAERFSSSRTITGSGDTIVVTPRLTLRSAN